MKLDAMSLLAAKASGELASNVGFLSLTQKCIRNGSHKMSVVLQEKRMTVNVNVAILFYLLLGTKDWEVFFQNCSSCTCSNQRPFEGKVSLSLTVDFLLCLKIKYKEEYEKTKGKVMGTTDSRLLHSLQVAKMSSEVNSFLPQPFT